MYINRSPWPGRVCIPQGEGRSCPLRLPSLSCDSGGFPGELAHSLTNSSARTRGLSYALDVAGGLKVKEAISSMNISFCVSSWQLLRLEGPQPHLPAGGEEGQCFVALRALQILPHYLLKPTNKLERAMPAKGTPAHGDPAGSVLSWMQWQAMHRGHMAAPCCGGSTSRGTFRARGDSGTSLHQSFGLGCTANRAQGLAERGSRSEPIAVISFWSAVQAW